MVVFFVCCAYNCSVPHGSIARLMAATLEHLSSTISCAITSSMHLSFHELPSAPSLPRYLHPLSFQSPLP